MNWDANLLERLSQVIRSLAIFMNHEEELVDGFLERRMPMFRLLGSVAWNNHFGLFFVLFNLHLCIKVQVALSTHVSSLRIGA